MLQHLVIFMSRVGHPVQEGEREPRPIKMGTVDMPNASKADKFCENFNAHMSLSDDHELTAVHMVRVNLSDKTVILSIDDCEQIHDMFRELMNSPGKAKMAGTKANPVKFKSEWPEHDK